MIKRGRETRSWRKKDVVPPCLGRPHAAFQRPKFEPRHREHGLHDAYLSEASLSNDLEELKVIDGCAGALLLAELEQQCKKIIIAGRRKTQRPKKKKAPNVRSRLQAET